MSEEKTQQTADEEVQDNREPTDEPVVETGENEMQETTAAADIRVVEFGNKLILGTLEDKGKNVIVTGVEAGGGISIKKSMVEYLKKSNIGELKSNTFRGKGHYSERPLTSDEEIHYNHLVNIFDDVQKKATSILVNDLFDQALGNQ